MTWLLAALAILGAVLVATGRPRMAHYGHALWMLSNAGWFMHNATLAQWAAAMQFGVFFILSVWGFVSWGERI